MKKRFVGAVLGVLVAALALAGCGAGDAAGGGVTGRYEGYAITVLEEHSPIEDTYDAGENYVELNDDGTASVCLDGSPIDATYAVDGEDITITIGGGEDETYDSTGTVKDGVLTFDFLGMGLELTFVKDGVDKPFELVASTATTDDDASADDSAIVEEETVEPTDEVDVEAQDGESAEVVEESTTEEQASE